MKHRIESPPPVTRYLSDEIYSSFPYKDPELVRWEVSGPTFFRVGDSCERIARAMYLAFEGREFVGPSQ